MVIVDGYSERWLCWWLWCLGVADSWMQKDTAGPAPAAPVNPDTPFRPVSPIWGSQKKFLISWMFQACALHRPVNSDTLFRPVSPIWGSPKKFSDIFVLPMQNAIFVLQADSAFCPSGCITGTMKILALPRLVWPPLRANSFPRNVWIVFLWSPIWARILI